jgi:hypothetical protein
LIQNFIGHILLLGLIPDKVRVKMEISSSSMANQLPGMTILKSANKQSELAGDLISKTVASMLTTQKVQASSEQVTVASSQSATGGIINTVA